MVTVANKTLPPTDEKMSLAIEALTKIALGDKPDWHEDFIPTWKMADIARDAVLEITGKDLYWD